MHLKLRNKRGILLRTNYLQAPSGNPRPNEPRKGFPQTKIFNFPFDLHPKYVVHRLWKSIHSSRLDFSAFTGGAIVRTCTTPSCLVNSNQCMWYIRFRTEVFIFNFTLSSLRSREPRDWRHGRHRRIYSLHKRSRRRF
ncbi:unnamed protein product [Phyllotreta striolata]|uniref:Uncharacterized protein n=1 Tax=Phyllotreta striolata TaxID=444603 RepID=A0A9N9XV08_PHYSR|nr:unnamed protein product [Phyllotreta striolata]